MKRLILDAVDVLFWVAMSPIIAAMRRAVRDELSHGEITVDLAEMEAEIEVWEPQTGWRARWNLLTP